MFDGVSLFFFFNDTATPEIYTLSLHDALPILFSHIETNSHITGSFKRLTFSINRPQDRKSGSAGMPRPISYAVFCLKKKNSRDIGRIVLQQLQGSTTITDVVRIRYAMVFLGKRTQSTGFHRLSDFLGWLEAEYGPPRVIEPESTPWVVLKRSGKVEPFWTEKLIRSIDVAAEGRGTDEQVRSLALNVTSVVKDQLKGQTLVTSQQIGAEALKALRQLDPLAYLRYASAVKRYRSVDDFWLDALGLEADGVRT